MHLEIFSEGDSFLHRADEKLKLGSFILFAACISLSSGYMVALLYLAAAAAMCALARLNFRGVIHRLYFLNVFVLFFWLLIPLGFAGDSSRGGELALSITLKANAIVLLTIALIGTTSLVKLTAALRCFGMPDKLACAVYFCIRYITVLHSDYTRTINAMKARGFRFKAGAATYKMIGNMLGVLLVKSHIYSQKLYNAMLCRGFTGKFPVFSKKTLSRRDYIFACVSLMFFMLSLWINQ